MRNLPNMLSAIRLLLSPYVVVLSHRGEHTLSFILFTALLISDAVDGAIARLFKAQTRLGKLLDPLADKVLLISGILTLTLYSEHRIHLSLIKLVVIRDLILIGGTMFLRKFGFVPQPSIWGKSATVSLGATVILGFLLGYTENALLLKMYVFLQLLSGAFVLVSGADYTIKGVIFIRSKLIMERR